MSETSKEIDTGGPAFPIIADEFHLHPNESGTGYEGFLSIIPGMSKRDLFAAFAMAGQMGHHLDDGVPSMAKARIYVEAADMLIAALKENAS